MDTTTNFSYICYKQREKPGVVGLLEKNFENHISGFFFRADFAGFTHILSLKKLNYNIMYDVIKFPPRSENNIYTYPLNVLPFSALRRN